MIEVKIDANYLLKLAGKDKDFVVGILDDFGDSATDQIKELHTQITPVVQLETIRTILHRLKGSSSSLGMVSLSLVFVEMENWTSDQWQRGKGDINLLIEHLKESLRLCRQVLK